MKYSDLYRTFTDLPISRDAWFGNLMVPDSPFVADGFLLFRRDGLIGDRAPRVGVETRHGGNRTAAADSADHLWKREVGRAVKPLRFVRVITARGGEKFGDAELYRVEFQFANGLYIYLHALRCRLVTYLTNADRVTGSHPRSATVWWRDGQPIGLLMPCEAWGSGGDEPGSRAYVDLETAEASA